MYLSKKLKVELLSAGVDIEDKEAVKSYFAEKRMEEERQREAAEEEKRRLLTQLHALLQPHAPSQAELKLFELIKSKTQGKVYKWLYMVPQSLPAEEILEDFRWKDLEAVNYSIPRFDLSRLKACGLIVNIEGHYKTVEEASKVEVLINPIEHFENREAAIEFLLKRVPREIIRLKGGKIVFSTGDLVRDVIKYKGNISES